jgi:predicted permease
MRRQIRPPRLARALLRLIASAEIRAHVEADMDEEFTDRAAADGPRAARRWYWRYAALSILDWWKGSGAMRGWRPDLGVAVRSLVRRPAFTLVVLLTLAVGVGATTAVFGVVHGVLLRPLPYPDAVRLFYLWQRGPGGGLGWVSGSNFMDWREGLTTFDAVAALTPSGFNATGAAGPERIPGMEVSPDFFRVLGVNLELGGGFLESEPAARVAVISHELWQRQYGGDPAVRGETLTLEDEPYEIVGVVPAGQAFPEGTAVWVPLDLGAAEWRMQRGIQWLNVIGRVKDDVSPDVARREVETLGARMAAELADVPDGAGIEAVPLMEEVVGDVRSPLLILSGAVALVLLVVCVNVAGLFLVRSAGRRREAAIRLSLGSSRIQLATRFLAETLLLSLAGGALGLLFAGWAVRTLRWLAPAGTPRIEQATLSGTVLVFGIGLSLLTGLVAGLLPALREAATELRQEITFGRTEPRTRRWSSNALVLAQVALAVVLVVGAAHLIETFRQLRRVDPGFRASGVLTASLPLTESRYDTDETIETFYRELVLRVEALPGVQSAGVVSILPISGQSMSFSFEMRDPGGLTEQDRIAGYQSASAGYFEAMGIGVVSGRPFRDGEGAADEPVVIVDEAFEARYFPNGAIGQEILAVGDAWRRVVGVVRSVKRNGMRGDPSAMFYVPLGQDPRDAMTLVLRTAGDPVALAPAVRAVVAELDPQQPVASVRSMEDIVSSSLAQPRFTAGMVGFFGLATLFLAMLAVYGLVSAVVIARTRELGIRMALGARAGQVRRMVFAHGMTLAFTGLVTGVLASVPAVRALRTTLFGVAPFQPVIVLLVVAVTLLAGAFACWLPARRATRVDPAASLRWD